MFNCIIFLASWQIPILVRLLFSYLYIPFFLLLHFVQSGKNKSHFAQNPRPAKLHVFAKVIGTVCVGVKINAISSASAVSAVITFNLSTSATTGNHPCCKNPPGDSYPSLIIPFILLCRHQKPAYGYRWEDSYGWTRPATSTHFDQLFIGFYFCLGRAASP